jgi:hypothetical protein
MERLGRIGFESGTGPQFAIRLVSRVGFGYAMLTPDVAAGDALRRAQAAVYQDAGNERFLFLHAQQLINETPLLMRLQSGLFGIWNRSRERGSIERFDSLGAH